jgi:hypothetical protein
MVETEPPAEDSGTIAAIEFIDRMKGSLPEALTERDLETLNAALRFFFADLRAAWELFQASEDHGRAGAIKALAATWRFIALFQQPLSENLQLPILRLQDALAALDDNNISPMLIPVPRTGRAASSGTRAALKGHAAGAVARLMQAGVDRRQACEQVAKTLTQLGVRPERGSGEITATTIRHWCDEVSADVSRQGAAATLYDSMFTAEECRRFSGLSSLAERQSLAIKSLEGFVRAALPELKKAT